MNKILNLYHDQNVQNNIAFFYTVVELEKANVVQPTGNNLHLPMINAKKLAS